MAQGSPGNPPPQGLREALSTAASLPSTARYIDVLGDPPLRRLFSEETKLVYGCDTDVIAEDVALTTGCNLAFVAAVMSLADAGDEVILPTPWYFNHQMTLDLLGIRTVSLPTFATTGFMPSVKACQALITDKTKAIALVSPNNPTGAVYPPALLSSFAQLAHSHKIALIVDETYRDFILDSVPHTLFAASSIPPWRDYLVHLFSFSKSYAIPGFRLGSIIANPTFLSQVKTALDCLQICPSRVPQVALHTDRLLPQLRADIKKTAQAIADRHELFRRSLPDGWVVGSQGGYYAFVRHPYNNVDSTTLCKKLAEELGVVCLPDSFFMRRDEGASNSWIRFSVANVDDEQIVRVCERLEKSETVIR